MLTPDTFLRARRYYATKTWIPAHQCSDDAGAVQGWGCSRPMIIKNAPGSSPGATYLYDPFGWVALYSLMPALRRHYHCGVGRHSCGRDDFKPLATRRRQPKANPSPTIKASSALQFTESERPRVAGVFFDSEGRCLRTEHSRWGDCYVVDLSVVEDFAQLLLCPHPVASEPNAYCPMTIM